jgi:hemin uptake protein HemP
VPPTHIKESPPAEPASARSRETEVRAISSKELPGDAQRVSIEHAAERYLLRDPQRQVDSHQVAFR